MNKILVALNPRTRRKTPLILAIILLGFVGCKILEESEKTETYPSGNVKTVYPMKKGLRHGVAISYYDSSKKVIKAEMSFENDTAHGPARTYYKNGNLKKRATIYKKKYHGLFETFHENGELKSTSNYNLGEVDGRWFAWDSLGRYTGLGDAKNGNVQGFNVLEDTSFFWLENEPHEVKSSFVKQDYFVYSIIQKEETKIYFQSTPGVECTVVQFDYLSDTGCGIMSQSNGYSYVDEMGNQHIFPDSLVHEEVIVNGQALSIRNESCPFFFVIAKKDRWLSEFVNRL